MKKREKQKKKRKTKNNKKNKTKMSDETQQMYLPPPVYNEYVLLNKQLLLELQITDIVPDKLQEECCICTEDMNTSNSIVTDCGHNFCMKCTLGVIITCMKADPMSSCPTCPLCRQELHINSHKPISINK